MGDRLLMGRTLHSLLAGEIQVFDGLPGVGALRIVMGQIANLIIERSA